jgi:hypothetical protein
MKRRVERLSRSPRTHNALFMVLRGAGIIHAAEIAGVKLDSLKRAIRLHRGEHHGYKHRLYS